MDQQYTAIIADDHPVDRLAVVHAVRSYPFIRIGGIYSSSLEALQDAAAVQPDIAFLDIDMPGLDGFELRKKLEQLKACIFITSYPEYALESFDLAAFDFIVKPVGRQRFEQSMNRLQQYLEIIEKAAMFDHSMGGDAVFIKEGYSQVKLDLRDIIYLEALKDYTSIVTRQKKYCIHASLGNLLKEASFRSFIRIHRSYAVQKNYVEKIHAQELLAGNTVLPVGRMYKDALSGLLK